MALNMVAEDGSPMSADDIGLYVANNVRFTREEGGFDHFLFVSDDIGKDVCLIGNGPRGPENARLIAAAPDLLAALIASQGIGPLRMELEDCLDRERPALIAELEAIEAQVEAAIARTQGGDQ